MRPPDAALRRSVALAAAALILACAGGSLTDVDIEPSDADRERFARRRLEDSRALVAEGRFDAAERNLERGLVVLPDDPKLLRALARVLDAQGRPDEAREQRERADRLDPVPPLPNAAVVQSSAGLVVILVPPERKLALARRVPHDWPDGPAARVLRERLRVRLPDARVVNADPESISEAQRLLPRFEPRALMSLRVDRSYCGESLKDGAFAVAWLRVAASVHGRAESSARLVRGIVYDPEPPERCEERALALAVEAALAGGDAKRALAATSGAALAVPRSPAAWSRASLRELFPGIGTRITAEIETGRRELAAGRIAAAAESFRRALHVDPGDSFARTYLNEAELTLAIVRELDGAGSGDMGSPDPAPTLDPRLSPAQTAAAERLLREEQHRRNELLAALAVLDEDAEMPAERLREALRPSRIQDPFGFGPRLARERSGGEVVARAAYAPDGSILARYYYPSEGDVPVVREEDTNGDGAADRWIGYRGTRRAEIFEDEVGSGLPDLHFLFAKGGTPLERIEIDANHDGHPERIFHYRKGVLTGEDQDTTGDGRLDRFDLVDDAGNVGERAEDLDGDGEVDIRSTYIDGKLVRRALENPEALSDGDLLGRRPSRPESPPSIN